MIAGSSSKAAALVALTSFVSAVVLALLMASPTDAQPPRPPMPVVVQNGTNEAIPVALPEGSVSITGNVAVTNAPVVRAQQNGAWDVSVANLPAVQDVRVTNLPGGSALTRGTFGASLSVGDPAVTENIAPGIVLTDLYAQGDASGRCLVTLTDPAAPPAEALLGQHVGPAGLEFHLLSGLQGPLTISLRASGHSGEGCLVFGFWSGYMP